MALTRFYNPGTDMDGPVSGSLQVFSVEFLAITASETDEKIAVQLPTGMQFEVTDVSSFSGAVGAAGALLGIGTATNGEQIVADKAMVAGAMQHTIVDGSVPAGGRIYVQIVGGASTGTVALPIIVTITGHVSAPPTSIDPRGPTSPG